MIDVDLGGRVLLQKVRVSCDLQLRVVAHGLLRVQLRLSGLQLRLVLVLLDGEQQVALLDDRAVLEMGLFEISRHAGDQRDLIDRRGVAGNFQRIADGLHLRRHHGNARRGRLGKEDRRRFGASGNRRQGGGRHEPGDQGPARKRLGT